MVDYNDYMHKLKTEVECGDFDRMFNGIDQKIRRQNARKWGAFSGMVIILALSITLYANYVFQQTRNGDIMMSYVFGQSEVSDGPVIGYVFEE